MSDGMTHNCIGIGCRFAGCESSEPPPEDFVEPPMTRAFREGVVAEQNGDWAKAATAWRTFEKLTPRRGEKRKAAGRAAAAEVRANAKKGGGR